MAPYSINDLEQLSGIKAHTIRIWEQRYGLLKPKRNAANVRSYDRAGLVTLLQVALLNESGIKISRIASLSPLQASEATDQAAANSPEISVRITALVLAALHFDEAGFGQILDQAIKNLGFDQAMLQVVFQFLERIGSQQGTFPSACAGFARNLILRSLQAVINQLPLSASGNKARFLLFLPEKCSGEITLLFLNYLLRERNFPVLYLGGVLSLAEIREADSIFRADRLATVLPLPQANEPGPDLAERLAFAFPEKIIYLFPDGKPEVPKPSGHQVKMLPDISVFIREIESQ